MTDATNQISVSARTGDLPRLIEFVRDFGEQQQLSRPVIHRLNIVLEELFLNTVHHGHGGDSDEPVMVTLVLNGSHLDCRYEDCGPVFVPPPSLPGHLHESPEQRPVGGLGVVMAQALTERWQHTPGAGGHGNCLSFSFNLAAG